MRILGIFVFIISLFMGCSRQNELAIQSEMADLRKKIEALTPGLGEIMSTIQQHHAKLSYAGENENWALATYQLDEIKEGLDQGTELHDHFKDVKLPLKMLRKMMDQSLAELELAINKKNKEQFMTGFKNLTQSCNYCHQAANHSFIVIQVPTTPSFSNQQFTK